MIEQAANSQPISKLPEIPIFDIGDGGIALFEADTAADIIRLGQEQYGQRSSRVSMSCRDCGRPSTRNVHKTEIASISGLCLPRMGLYGVMEETAPMAVAHLGLAFSWFGTKFGNRLSDRTGRGILQPDMARFRRGRAGHGAGPVRGCVKSGATGASLDATRLRRLAV